MTSQEHPSPASVIAGLLTRKALAEQVGKSERTIIRFEHIGLPVIKIGATRLYDPAAARAWLMTFQRQHTPPKRGRPAGRVL